MQIFVADIAFILDDIGVKFVVVEAAVILEVKGVARHIDVLNQVGKLVSLFFLGFRLF